MLATGCLFIQRHVGAKILALGLRRKSLFMFDGTLRSFSFQIGAVGTRYGSNLGRNKFVVPCFSFGRFMATEPQLPQPGKMQASASSDSSIQPGQQQKEQSKTPSPPSSPLKRTKKSRKPVDFGLPRQLCNGYATADQYENMANLQVALAANHDIRPLPEDVGHDAIFCSMRSPTPVTPAFRKDFVVFWDGVVIFWNLTKDEQASVLKVLQTFERNPHPPQLVESEVENVDYVVADGGPARVINNTIIFNPSCSPMAVDDSDSDIEPSVLSKFAFSEAVRLSVRLGIWENQLTTLAESVDGVIDDLSAGRRLRLSRSDVLRHCGNLLLFRHKVNMASDLTQTPDFYWDRPQLEDLFRRTRSFLNVPHRTRLVNEKLNHSFELVELLRSHLNDTHHIRLEWMIIVLIMIEVVFDALPCMGRFFMP